MPNNSLSISNLEFCAPVVQFFPAQIKFLKSRGPVVEYSIYDFSQKKYKRNVIRLQRVYKRFAKKSDFMVYANALCIDINNRLMSSAYHGLSASSDAVNSSDLMSDVVLSRPDDDETVAVERHKLVDVVGLFLAEKGRELRPDSMRSYNSVLNMLCEWCTENGILYIDELTVPVAVKFMYYVYVDRQVSAAAYNNYLKLCRAFTNYTHTCELTEVSAFHSVKKKRADDKKRVPIPANERARFVSMADVENSHFVTFCMIVYGSLIRPHELTLLRIKHLNLDEHYITVPADVAKNHHERVVALLPEVVNRLRNLGVDKLLPNHYIFGRLCTPCAERTTRVYYSKMFRRYATALEWPASYTLYSLRDTGITEMLTAGIPSLEVMKHADHSSLDITTVYANHVDRSLISKIYKKCPKF